MPLDLLGPEARDMYDQLCRQLGDTEMELERVDDEQARLAAQRTNLVSQAKELRIVLRSLQRTNELAAARAAQQPPPPPAEPTETDRAVEAARAAAADVPLELEADQVATPSNGV